MMSSTYNIKSSINNELIFTACFAMHLQYECTSDANDYGGLCQSIISVHRCPLQFLCFITYRFKIIWIVCFIHQKGANSSNDCNQTHRISLALDTMCGGLYIIPQTTSIWHTSLILSIVLADILSYYQIWNYNLSWWIVWKIGHAGDIIVCRTTFFIYTKCKLWRMYVILKSSAWQFIFCHAGEMEQSNKLSFLTPNVSIHDVWSR